MNKKPVADAYEKFFKIYDPFLRTLTRCEDEFVLFGQSLRTAEAREHFSSQQLKKWERGVSEALKRLRKIRREHSLASGSGRKKS
jgi:hypothetical protein